MVFGVIGVVVHAVVRDVASRIVGVRRSQTIVCSRHGVEGVAGAICHSLIGAIAPGVVRPRETFAGLTGSGRRGRKSIQLVVAVGPIAICAVVGGHNVTVGSKAQTKAVDRAARTSSCSIATIRSNGGAL